MKACRLACLLASILATGVHALRESTNPLDVEGSNTVHHSYKYTSVSKFKFGHAFFHDLGTIPEPGQFHSISPLAHELMQKTAEGKTSPVESLVLHSRRTLMSRRPLSWLLDFRHKDHASLKVLNELEWQDIPVRTPDVTDKTTVVNLAKMTSNAYVLAPSQPDWLNGSMDFNHSDSFGWVGDGLRGHVFTDETNETVIIAFKGTTIDPREKWRSNDRLNDNLLFSCCCASQRPDPFWYGPVCNCSTDTYQCNSTCLTQKLLQKDRYYPTAVAVLLNITTWYPNATFWIVGHSLGGSIASLVGLTYNMPSVAYEAPPQRLAAQRLGITIPPRTADYHIGNTADPVFMGACNGYFSSCSIAGYAFESQCHTGKRCVYDTVGDLGWHVNINNHRLNVIIPDVLEALLQLEV
ncbi:Alpha/Beta hydrolase protein [Exophiala viscosa]|uniref:Putative lipase ATG15 n=1 Tax=Exophiala viscosa TaxID=2486360 RepID=A0AAN6E7D4_9EURO|nr:Alpha/Beta hydrolase protein [Exophiala viscosa]KAI1627280.1 Alpha/Beta hydrolase protein [Exophiala viscosa]